MKRTILILFSYTILAIVICIIYSFTQGNLPVLTNDSIFRYKLFNGILPFLEIFSAIALSGFTISFSIAFSTTSEKCVSKFSPAMIANYKNSIICALCIVFVLTLSKECISPLLKKQILLDERTPKLLEEYIKTGNENFDEENMLLAYTFAKQALLIAPSDTRAQHLLDKAQGSLERNSFSDQKKPLEKTPPKESELKFEKKLQNLSMHDLISLSENAAKSESWFDSHYFAELALSSAEKDDSAHAYAKNLAAVAWNNLSAPLHEQDSEQKKFYREKYSAYQLLIEGNTLQAYYKFLELSAQSREKSSDPDIVRYLRLAKEKLDETYFFIEETEDLRRFESSNDVFFRIPTRKGGETIFFIRGITPVKESGGLVQYLRGFSAFSYDSAGNFLDSVSTPYAKMLALDTSALKTFAANPIRHKEDEKNKKFKRVPYIMLESISRESNSGTIGPVYANAENNSSYMILPIPYSDFSKICMLSDEKIPIDLFSLFTIAKSADFYGFSRESIIFSLAERIFYPFEILIFTIFCAILAWNYRLKSGQIFKFTWIFILTIVSIVYYFLIKFGDYIFDFLTFNIVCRFDFTTFPICAVFYLAIFIILSINFLSHKAK